MNMQAIMKQAQKMQKDIMKEQEEIQKMEFTEENSQVSIKANGKKEISEIKIKMGDNLDSDDIEILEDSIMVALNNLFNKIDSETEKRMGKYGSGLSGLF